MNERTLGVIGGSGLYDLPGLEERREVEVETPFGKPSDLLITGRLHGVRMAFLPRHGRGHLLAPNELPFRANLYAMKQLGMECVLGISAVGSLKEHLHPGELVLVDQGFRYYAKPDFTGTDKFTLVVVGKNRHDEGTSTVEITVSRPNPPVVASAAGHE